jgi:sugar O-acyltransferase (sialic acid O-acetyltransferase NeuD family)
MRHIHKHVGLEKAIIGAGGFAREIKAVLGLSSIKFFVDEKHANPTAGIYSFSEFDPEIYEVVVAVGNPRDRFNIIQSLPKNTKYFTFVDSSVQIHSNDVEIGEGSIICAGSIITTNIKLGKHTHLNLLTTIGHDCVIDDYFTTAPGAKVSGNCNIEKYVYVGTNSSIREKLNICSDVTIGMNAAVVKHVTIPGIYVGVPAKKLK